MTKKPVAENATDIDVARDRLKAALVRLEEVVEKRVREAGVRAARAEENSGAKDMAGLKSQMATLQKELQHYKNENARLQQLLGEEQERSEGVRKANDIVGHRLDDLIGDLREVLENQGV